MLASEERNNGNHMTTSRHSGYDYGHNGSLLNAKVDLPKLLLEVKQLQQRVEGFEIREDFHQRR